ncbi:MAG: chorismate-binding protein, partial [Cyclobacteriaceae bacterium]|nr:chorismate-binding protein [Cyclobacteriaceae bacterium]
RKNKAMFKLSEGKIEVLHKGEENSFLERLIQAVIQLKGAFALWRLPNTDSKHLIINLSGIQFPEKFNLEESFPGFAVSSFDGKKYFIKADLEWTNEGNSLTINPTFQENEKIQQLIQLMSEDTPPTLSFPKRSIHFTDYKKEDYLNYVQDCVNTIQQGVIQKIVPSRYKKIELPEDLNILSVFGTLSNSYPNAFVSVTSSEEFGTWVGATPEILVSTENNQIFKTISLAGTQPLNRDIELRNVSWTQKEIEEQALVSRYIINCFKKIRLREFDEYGPKTAIAGNLMHLKTTFTVDMEDTNFPQLGTVMLDLLHPTSAVCGMPLKEARDFIHEHETFDRSLFAGFLGPVNIKNCSYLFVNLRCMELIDSHAILYAGAGVTIDSIPEQEWEETEIKMNTLLNIIHKA